MSFNQHVLEKLHELVLEQKEYTSNMLTEGVAISDFAAYKEQVGRLYAYRKVLELFDDAVKIVEKMV